MKTIEEEEVFLSNKNVLSNINWNDTSELERLKAKYYNGFKAGVEFAQRWISVEDELPEKQGYYLVLKTPLFRGNCNVVVAEFHEDNKTFYYQRSYSAIENITHWRPIELK